ncbi:MAG TPA: TIR domain-containing protein [Thermoanaerobaculia bacterium]|nr:TIR domain-containing protein [Thermoanaerobaculia bacterium]
MEKAKYDVFLSHATPDKPVVEELARILRLQGIEPWLDVWNLIPGEPWQEALEEALESCATCAVCLGPSGTGPWQNEEMRTAIERRVSGKGERFRVIPVLLPRSTRGEPSRLPPFLRNTGWVEFRETLDDEKVLHRLISGIRGVQPGPGPGEAVAEGAQPYRGLQVFDVDDAPFFFGREALTEWLLDKLRPVPNGSRFLAIFGPSGSGKSSLARAGLLAAVKRGEIAGSDSWPTIVFKPGEKPLETLAVQLAALGGFPSVFELLRDLAADKRALHLNARVALSRAPADRRLLVLVDQFEEVFTLCSDEAQRTAFIDNLLHAAMAADGPTLVVLTLRADFYGRCAVYPDLAPAVSDRQTLVGPMNRDELRSAIERPAYLAGCELEGGLTELLLKEVETQPGCLPLLEYALLQIWQHREGRRLTTTAYNEVHGVTGALETRAEEVYAKLTTAEGEACRQILLKLVQVDDQGRATKRRLGLAELAPEAEPEGKATASVVARLTDARLLIAEAEGDEKRPTIEVAHEALLTGWKRLKDWIEQDRESLQTRRRLEEAVVEWTGKDRDPSYLYTGSRLARAEEWAGSHPGESRPEAQEFLAASRTQEEQEAQRELAQARALEDEQRRRADAEQQRAQEQASARQRLKKWTIAFAATAVAAAVGFVIALRLFQEAEQNRLLVTATELGRQARTVLTKQKDPALSLLLSIAAVRRTQRAGQPHLPAAEEPLREALMVFHGTPLPTGRVQAASLSADREWLAVAGTDGAISLWHLTDGGPVKAAGLELESSFHLAQIAVSPGGRWVLVSFKGSPPSLLLGVDLKAGHELSRQKWPGEDWQGNPFSPDGRWLLTRRLGRWIVRDLRRSSVPTVMSLEVAPKASAFSPDGRWLAIAEDGALRIRDMTTGREFQQPPQVNGSMKVRLSFSSDSQWLVESWQMEEMKTGYDVYAWRMPPLQGSEPPAHLDLEACATSNPVAPNWQDSLLVSQIPVLVECLPTIQPLRSSALCPQQIITAVATDPAARRFAVGCGDGSVVLKNWDSGSIGHPRTNSQVGPVQFLALRGSWLFAQGGNDPPRALKIGNGTTPTELEPAVLDSLDDSKEATQSAESVPRPRPGWIAVASNGFGLILEGSNLRLRNSRGPQPLPDGENASVPAAFSPDAHWLAAAGSDGQPRVWRVQEDGTVSPPISFPGQYRHSQRLTRLAFSPDGHWLATSDSAGESRLWDLKQPSKEPQPLTNHTGPVKGLAFSIDGRQVATAGEDGAVWVRELNRELARADLPYSYKSKEPVIALAFLSDGQLALDGHGRGVRLWTLGKQEIPLDSVSQETTKLLTSPKGNRLARGSLMGTIEVWSSEGGDLPKTPVRWASGLLLAFTPDGNGLLTVNLLGRLLRWELRTDKLLATACQAVGRNLTEKEWRTYIPSEPYREREPCPDLPKAFD